MATYDITSSSFNIEDVVDGDILTCPYTGSETHLKLPAGTYTVTVVGASGNWAGRQSTPTATYIRTGGTAFLYFELSNDFWILKSRL